MKVATFNGCKVYNLSNNKTLPLFLSERKKRALAKDEDYRRRLELIQDFEMPTATQCLKMTKDGEHIIATGTYPPVVKCYTVSDMALKFQRGLNAEVVAFECLSDNFGKLVFLQTDRNLNFHAPYGTHYSVRIPKFGRDLQYHWSSCDLFVGACGDEVYRLNLETGMFKEPFSMSYSGCNKLHINPVHPLLACGGEEGICEFWDLRSRTAVSRIRLPQAQRGASEITALKFDTDGLTLGLGSSDGNCVIYDIRSSTPLYTKEHQYGLPIIDIAYHNESGHIISTDKKIAKVWKRSGGNMGQILTNIEPPCDINALLPVRDQRGPSGLMFIGGEQSRVMSYFVPQLGPAPRWCSFLEGITEELEETALGGPGGSGSAYEDYKFLTRAEVEDLGASGLIGTPMLKGYMHGFFIEMGLYSKLRAVSKPFEYEEHRKARIRDKIEERRQSRINAQKRLPKVNKQLAEKFMKTAPSADKIVDDRFAALFKREEFEQDVESHEYRLRNPSGGAKSREDAEIDSEDDELGPVRDIYTLHEDSDADSVDDEDFGYESSASGDSIGPEVRYHSDSEDRPKSKSKDSAKGRDKSEGAILSTTQKMLKRSAETGNETAKRKRKAKMFELAAGVSAERAVFAHTPQEAQQRKEKRKAETRVLSDRLAEAASSTSNDQNSSSAVKIIKTDEGIVREMSFIPQKVATDGDRLERANRRDKSEYIPGMEMDSGSSEKKSVKKRVKKK
mmetsp:Transcript_3098/g.4768  ORF Transcript_3098/g.4768 Transcript_3098/m.4768 type:complete len:732 (+) Transcript_3098:125-2320(+)|eukprot:CAMPEP_0185038514 /NCGR_PEP_ID=MMETSP1103-20130426/34256_1 /TAXON_ID=36769 /ORGANISM="Paraphysomonas bandaiensis, Strain Caron Lab Isolate" /LENGTH=731 /DNA_ID=CAMNT_0027576979 /DNA_START=87 /DNA_END=2282 /DNA_ORIENTATION=+